MIGSLANGVTEGEKKVKACMQRWIAILAPDITTGL
jgi:hypothetical protein